MDGAADDFSHLDPAGRATAMAARRPAALVYGLLALGVALAWAMLAALAVRAAAARPPGEALPGDGLLRDLPMPALPDWLERFFALCLGPAPAGVANLADLPVLTLMWFLMALAMMLPSAAPMIRTYCEIADTAAAKGERAVHPLVLVAGYLAVWLAASVAFAGVGLGLSTLAARPALDTLPALAAAGALVVAGLYQFTSLKHACLQKCRNPFATLFSRWSARPAAIFRLGVEQGLWCLGCCWALMLVMFAVGTMNVFWMALIAAFTLVEKGRTGVWPGRLAGAFLLVWAAALLLISA